MSRAVSESLIDRESNVVLIGLSVITCVALLLAAIDLVGAH
jgi:hypothetical protein